MLPPSVRLSGLALAAVLTIAGTGGARAQSLQGLTLDAPTLEPAAAELLRRETAGATPAPTPVPPPAAGQPPARPGFAPDDGAGAPEPFGANLFRGGFANDREDGLNRNYVIQPGDRVAVRIWGAIEFDQTLSVDPQGNIFIPKVGPVRIGGTANRDLNGRVTASVRQVFTDNVRVYTSLNGAQPVAVFVTGYVPRPGRFSGIPSNSPLHFVDRAGGIDAMRGSYRDVRVLRDGDTLAAFDLYDFLLEGALPSIQFRDGDTIVVGERGPAVAVTGDVAEPVTFELAGESLSGAELARAALLDPGVSHAGISGVRGGEPFSVYLVLGELAAFPIEDGDEVHFRRDLPEREIVVEVEGMHDGPSRFAVPRDTRLQQLLDYIEVDPVLADIDAVSLRRPSIAARQKQSLEESLNRLETTYLTAPVRTDAEVRIRSQEAQLVSNFVARARQVQPNGRLVVAHGGDVADVLLQPGDVVSIPRASDSVLLSGEVLVSQAMLHREGLRARDYIEAAGGFTAQADERRIVLVHPNGEVASAKNPEVRPGDELIVLPEVPSKNLQLAATIVDIVYKIAVAAAVVINL